MEVKEDACISIILRRPFLATIEAMIDVKNGKFFLQVGDEKVEFHLPMTMATPTLDDTYCRVDVLEKVPSRETMTYYSVDDPLEPILIHRDVTNTQTGEKEEYARLLNVSTTYTPRQCPKEILNIEVQASK